MCAHIQPPVCNTIFNDRQKVTNVQWNAINATIDGQRRGLNAFDPLLIHRARAHADHDEISYGPDVPSWVKVTVVEYKVSMLNILDDYKGKHSDC